MTQTITTNVFFFFLIDVVASDRDDWKQRCDDYAAAVEAQEKEEDEASLQQQLKRYKKELVQAHEVRKSGFVSCVQCSSLLGKCYCVFEQWC